MPYRAASKVKGLYKKHNLRCANANGDPDDCDCPWYGRYKGISKGLAAWAGKEVDPRTKAGAEAVLRRLKTAIDEKKYSPEGEQQSLGSGQRFSDFVLGVEDALCRGVRPDIKLARLDAGRADGGTRARSRSSTSPAIRCTSSDG